MASGIIDVWFRTELSLNAIALKRRLINVQFDCEDYWEWAIGTFVDTTLDITRTHTLPPDQTDTRIFLCEKNEFPPTLLDNLLSCLGQFITGAIKCGRWIPQADNEFDRVVMQEYSCRQGNSGV